jgi:hypothetical protein
LIYFSGLGIYQYFLAFRYFGVFLLAYNTTLKQKYLNLITIYGIDLSASINCVLKIQIAITVIQLPTFVVANHAFLPNLVVHEKARISNGFALNCSARLFMLFLNFWYIRLDLCSFLDTISTEIACGASCIFKGFRDVHQKLVKASKPVLIRLAFCFSNYVFLITTYSSPYISSHQKIH